jgi:hypothetical protein
VENDWPPMVLRLGLCSELGKLSQEVGFDFLQNAHVRLPILID